MTVTVYSDTDYKGKSATLGEGGHKLSADMNDCISSVRVPAGWKVTLHEHADFTGEKITLNSDTPKLDGALHDKASSIVVEEDGSAYIFSAENGDNWFYFEDTTTVD